MISFSFLGFSQITISSTNVPQTDDTLRVSDAVIDDAMDFISTGTDYTWDFSNLQFNGQKLNEYQPVTSAGVYIQFVFGSSVPQNYRASYYVATNGLPLNNLPAQLPITISDISQFYKLQTDSLTMVGLKMSINGQEVPAKSDTIETKYQFPLEYGNSHFSRGYTKLDLNPIYDGIWIQHRTRQTDVDGWGQITTPLGSFNALRIHHRITESDSFYVSFNGFAFWLPIPVPESHEYEWRALEEKEPILLVKTNVNQGSETVTSVEYKNVYTVGINENDKISVSVYPNPVQDWMVIQSPTKFDEYSIFSTDGKLILSGKLTNGAQQMVDVSGLKSGSYMIQLNSNSGVSVKNFVK
jgi:hypothetical protein